ncbi:HAD hydrolase-like protein [Candidatus Micrarchaeota archaeon]|nr:HAD hydrolase-like protein [Candidatus Micrarchaeota archaeon]
MIDLSSKKIFLFDLDDTLIDTSKSRKLGLERAYQKLVSECTSNPHKLPAFDEFEQELTKLYKSSKDEDGGKFYDYDAKVFEEYCSYLSKIGSGLKHTEFSLAARLCWHYRQTKNNSLMARNGAFELLKEIGKTDLIYCVTEGKCNYQHTKAMLTDIEEMVDSVIVTKEKVSELKGFIEQRGFNKSETVMIGDSENDITAGKSANVSTICVKHEGRNYDSFKVQADLTVNSLVEVLEHLRSKK